MYLFCRGFSVEGVAYSLVNKVIWHLYAAAKRRLLLHSCGQCLLNVTLSEVRQLKAPQGSCLERGRSNYDFVAVQLARVIALINSTLKLVLI